MRVTAVVVTWNRLALLKHCLAALRAQTVPPQRILVVDNASTDGTAEWLATTGVEILRLPRNTGGAGGFHAGLAAAARGDGWIWAMDDDCLPDPDALAQLITAATGWVGTAPVLYASRVVDAHGAAHPMNRVAFAHRYDRPFARVALRRKLVSIRAASFVSLLFPVSAVHRWGLPIAEYFLWLDDIEWTARLLRDARGVWVPRSRVVHLAATATTLDANPERFARHVRNSVWMLRCSRAWRPLERVHRGLALGWTCVRWSCRNPLLSALTKLSFASWQGFVTQPPSRRSGEC